MVVEKNNSNQVNSISSESLSHMTKQFECLWKHLEYHDSNIFRIMSIYFAFAGIFVAKIELFTEAPMLASIMVAIVSTVFSLLLLRTSSLLTELKKNIQKIDLIIIKIHGESVIDSVPTIYIKSKLRTSLTCAIAIPIFALALVFKLMGIFSA